MTTNRIRPWALAIVALALLLGAGAITTRLLDIFHLETGSGLRRIWYEIMSTILEIGLLGFAWIAIRPRRYVNMRWTRPTLGWVALSVPIAAACLALHYVLGLVWPLGWGASTNVVTFPHALSTVGFVIYGTISLGISPIVQELYFRGWILSAVERVHPLAGILVSALLFAFFDAGTGFGSVYIFLFGLIYGTTAVASRSVFVPALIHVLVNSAAGSIYLARPY